LPQNVWIDIVNNPFVDIITYEDIFIFEKRSFRQAIAHAIEFTEDGYAGIELDLDSVADVLCSANTPSGITEREARQYISFVGAMAKPAYLHICEGAAQLADGKVNGSVGKFVSYLVSDFIKANENRD
jgi:formiminoglutamase